MCGHGIDVFVAFGVPQDSGRSCCAAEFVLSLAVPSIAKPRVGRR